MAKSKISICKALKKLLLAERNFSPCNKCDVSGELLGSKHANEWKKFNEKLVKKIHRSNQDLLDRSKYLRLDKNERVIPFEKKFLKFLKKKIGTFNLSAYPNTDKIKKLIAKKIKVKNNMIYMSAGSDISLKTCFELFTKKNDKVIIIDPTFGMVNVYCDLYGLKTIKIGYDKNLILDYKKLFKNISNQISLIILANPNSPTGTIVPEEIMLKILIKTKKKYPLSY